jgi:hypothetical protein
MTQITSKAIHHRYFAVTLAAPAGREAGGAKPVTRRL